MKKFLNFLFVLCLPLALIGQISFSNQTAQLFHQTIRSGAPIGIADMDADGLDDIVRLHEGNSLVIDYQTPSGVFMGYTYGTLIGGQWSISIGDIDGNGYNDIFTGGSYDGLKLLKANPAGNGYSLNTISFSNTFLQGSNMVDIDGDLDLDIFACHDDGISQPYENTGNGNMQFNPNLISAASTVPSDNSGNYGSVWIDYDNDKDLDLYISKCRLGVTNPNDGRRLNLLFQNDGTGHYTEVAAQAGLQPHGQSWATDFGDIDNDGDLDAIVINHDIPNVLYRNEGNGVFTDITMGSGISVAEGGGIQVKFVDFDNDGFIDILFGGNSSNYKVLRNNGNSTFTGLLNVFPGSGSVHSFSTGDLNNDGFIDVLASFGSGYNTPSPTVSDRLYMNEGNNNHFIKLNLDGVISNENGVGARVELYGAWGKQIREVRSGESYGISTSHLVHFGLGQNVTIDSVVVQWPSGTEDHIIAPGIDQTLNVTEGSDCFLSIDFTYEVDDLTVSFQEASTLGATSWLWTFGDGTSSSEQNPVHTYAEPDIYTVTLNVIGICGTGQILRTINVSCTPPVSNFMVSNLDGLTATFEDLSTNSPNTWMWNFGDGSAPSFDQNPTHTFPQEGYYTICFLAQNNCGFGQICRSTLIGCLETVPGFVSGSSQLSAFFTNTSSADVFAWAWDFGDGSTSNMINPNHTYSQAGTYEVCLVVTGACGDEELCQTIVINCPPPTVNFSTNITNRTVAVTPIIGGGANSLLWDFGDGTTANTNAPTHQYEENGTYQICLTATNACGPTTVCQTVTIDCIIPEANFEIVSVDGFTVTVHDLSTNNPTAWRWDFGDMSMNLSYDQNPAPYTYAQEGGYSICMMATNECGSTAYCAFVEIGCNEPQAAFTSQTNELAVNFTDTSTESPDTWSWNFGDGTTSTQQHPNHQYAQPGQYNVCLEITNACGTSEVCNFVEVSCPAPDANFSTQITDLVVQFFDNSSPAATSWLWTFGDGQAANVQHPIHTYATGGTYQVCLMASSICGTSTICKQVVANCLAPESGFDFSSDGLSISLMDISANNPTGWMWTFGDGQNSTMQNPNHVYSSPGTYDVCLQATNQCGSTTVCQNVTVSCTTPIASFSTQSNGLEVNFLDQSINSPTNWLWDFGDGQSSTLSSPSHTYAMPGAYMVCLQVNSVCGDNQMCTQIQVSCTPPSPSFVVDINDLVANFTGEVAMSVDTWFWNFGDGTFSSEQNPIHNFAVPGNYNVCVEITNVCGSSQFCQEVLVSCTAPTSNFTFSSDGLNVSYFDQSSGEISNWVWTFGDGGMTVGASPNYSYSSPGTYQTCLEVSGICGSDIYCQEVTVDCAAPVGLFGYEAAGLLVNFEDQSSGGPSSWSWDFGDGNTSSEENPTYTYNAPGTYTVCLAVESVCGSDVKCANIVVECESPVSQFSYSTTNLTVMFTDLSTGLPDSWTWTFGDGVVSTAQHPTHQFTQDGTYTICLTTENECGAGTTECRTITLDCALPLAQFSVNGTGSSLSFQNVSTGLPSSWLWDFGDGSTSVEYSPNHTFLEADSYNVCLTVTNDCGQSMDCQLILIIDAINTPESINSWEVMPNPVSETLYIKIDAELAQKGEVRLYAHNGQLLRTQHLDFVSGMNSLQWSVDDLSAGLYFVQLRLDDGVVMRRIVVE